MGKIKDLPNWLKVLPHKKYKLDELVTITRKSKPNLVITLGKLGLHKEYVQKGKSHVFEVYYIWDGKDPRKEMQNYIDNV